MAGHSKWSKVKHIKAVEDVRKGRVFSKWAKEIAVAARAGGGDLATNARLRTAVQGARDANVSNDIIERAIRRGAGELEGGAIEEILYEGYAPGGVAVLVETATDNKNRTAADIRLLFTKHHGHLAAAGAVAYLFHRRGVIHVPRDVADEQRLMELTLDAGAEDIAEAGDHWEISSPAARFYAVAEALRAGGITPAAQRLAYIPSTHAMVDDEHVAAQVTHLLDALEDNDDVQHVHSNLDLPDAVAARLPA